MFYIYIYVYKSGLRPQKLGSCMCNDNGLILMDLKVRQEKGRYHMTTTTVRNQSQSQGVTKTHHPVKTRSLTS